MPRSLRVGLATLTLAACAPAIPAAVTAPALPVTAGPAPTEVDTAEPPLAPVASPPPERDGASVEPAELVTSISSDDPVVALTFDAGSDTGFTAQILDTLEAHGIAATFGITGRWAEANPMLTRRIAAAGHGLINHTYDHASFTGFSTGQSSLAEEERRLQIERTEHVIRDLTGTGTKPYFRPPYGDYDEALLFQLGAWGYRYNVMWTVDSLGWKGLTAEEIIARCLEGSRPGAIYLFHVGSASQDAAALPALIEGLRERSYTFATVHEALPAWDS